MKNYLLLNKKRIGYIEDNTFYRKGQLFRLYSSVGMTKEILDNLESQGVEKVRTTLTNLENRVFDIELKKFKDKAILVDCTEYGFEPQLFVRLYEFTEVKNV